jgi:hypothetical protein
MEYLCFSLEETCVITARNFGKIAAAFDELAEYGADITIEGMPLDEWRKLHPPPKGRDALTCRLCVEYDDACSYSGFELIKESLATVFSQSPAFSGRFRFAGDDDDWLFGRKKDIPSARYREARQKINNILHDWLTPKQRRQLLEEMRKAQR